ncbi:hypothetical protein [Shewanella acanthi]|uniref:hypothetical protein n=1 Tax=Shewanella acanthi TaxID=2864212 RepID=UPI001C65F075|nr:hypothetical protein [Shewanella acanthi]QYJ80479.1 hypothetical protein K0H61_09000 [Shewanella acanthi]
MPPMAETIAIISALVAGLSALYARWSAREARKANDIGRLNSLLAFRQHYLELMAHQEKLAQLMPSSSSGMEACRNAYADLDSKLREINQEISDYHIKVVENKI